MAAGLALPATSMASNLIDRAARRPTAATLKLQVNKENVALLTYRSVAGGRRVIAWGAENAVAPTTARDQESFKLQYMGTTGRIRTEVVKGTFVNACRKYTGPKLDWFVTGCTARDGSWWAVQAWQRALPNYGLKAPRDLAVWEIRLSHWSGELPVLTMKSDWSYGGQFDHFYGSVTYRGRPMHGFRTTSYGAPLDKYGVLIYLDTFNSEYGRGWRRENSFVTHKPSGIFCYGMGPHGSRPSGKGTKYRATMVGPGALPDIMWTAKSVGKYDPAKDKIANEEQAASFSDKSCRPN
ncbi:MAG: hypothetical protein ABR521_05925 [Gaiellaceae bacterium]